MIIYSCITNSYDKIPDHYYDPDVRYVMFHDGTIKKEGPWEFIELDIDIKCPRRLSAYPKINPDLYFDEGERTVWVDACYQMTKEFVDFSKTVTEFTILRHPNRFSYYDEMLEGFLCSFYTWDQGIRITEELAKEGYDFRKYRSPLGTIIYRTIDDQTRKFDMTWWKYFDMGPNRDQISFDAALQLNGFDPPIIEDRNGCGMSLGHYSKVGRLGKHPKDGDPDYVLRRNDFLSALRDIIGMSYIYAKFDHSFMINFNADIHMH